MSFLRALRVSTAFACIACFAGLGEPSEAAAAQLAQQGEASSPDMVGGEAAPPGGSSQRAPIDLGAAEDLPGTWLGYGACSPQPVTFKLAIRADLANPGDVIVEAGGGLPPLTLKGGFDPATKRFKVEPVAWRVQGAYTDPFRLEMTYLADSGLLVIDKVAASGTCAAMAARKVQVMGLPANAGGLLFKTPAQLGAIAEAMTTLSVDDCKQYALWLASHTDNADSRPPAVRALADMEGMNRVLGKNLWSWTNGDSDRYNNLWRACESKVQNTLDIDLAAAVQAIYARIGWMVAPLNVPPDNPGAEPWYDGALTQVYADLIKEIRLDQRRLAEGLIGKGLVTVPESPGDRRGRLAAMPLERFAGEWFGEVTCTNSADPSQSAQRLARLQIDDAANPAEGQLHLGPYVSGTGFAGAMTLAVEHDQGGDKARLTMTKAFPGSFDWGRPSALTVEASYDSETGDLTGATTGLSDHGWVCDRIAMKKIRRTPTEKDPDGILFQAFYAPGEFFAPRLTVQHCERLLRWQTEFESYDIRNETIYAGLFDQDRLRQVFGKDMYQWNEVDAVLTLLLVRECKNVITTDGNPERLALMARVEASNVSYGWDVLTNWFSSSLRPDDLEISGRWFEVEHLMREILATSERVSAEIAEIGGVPPTLELVGRIDGLLAALAPQKGAIAPYLTPGERDGFDAQLRGLRAKAGVGYAMTVVGELKAFPATLDGLHQAEAHVQRVTETMQERGLDEGRSELERGFAAESRERALALWPQHVESSRAAFSGLQGADFSRWRVLNTYQDMSDALLKFLNPSSEGGEVAAAFAEMEAQKTTLAAAMLAASEEKLIQWMEALPPSLGATGVVESFAAAAQRVGVDARSRPRLDAAMSAVANAYNPLGLARPDIAGALMRRHWSEVTLTGIEEVAYLMTMTRGIENACPGKVKASMGASEAALLGFVGSLTAQATRHAFTEGPRTHAEGMRMVMLFFNTVANQPGCEVDYFGNVVNCTTEEDFFATQEFIMTSGEGAIDTGILTAQGCSGEPLEQYLGGLREYVSGAASPGPGQPLVVPTFEEAVGSIP